MNKFFKWLPWVYIRITPKGREALVRSYGRAALAQSLMNPPDPIIAEDIQEAIDKLPPPPPPPTTTIKIIDSIDQLPRTPRPPPSSHGESVMGPSPWPSWSWLIFPMISIIITLMIMAWGFGWIGGTQADQLPPLECHSPWVMMSPGLPTAHQARVNLDQHGSWIILAPEWLVIWSPDHAVAAHGLGAWEAEVSLGISSDPDVCGFVNVIMGTPLIIPRDEDLVTY